MKEIENKKSIVRLTGANASVHADPIQYSAGNKAAKLKKTLVFGLMAIVFVGCMCLIFQPSEEERTNENSGLNDAVPQVTGSAMPDDKAKAYEQETLDRKEQEKRNALATLSDYWNTEAGNEPPKEGIPENEQDNGLGAGMNNAARKANHALNSYQNLQSTMGSFYQDNPSETAELRKQLEEMKAKLAEKDLPTVATLDDQLKLMEKSYEMAARYLPQNTTTKNPATADLADQAAGDVAISGRGASQKERFVAFTPKTKSAVSSLYRTPSDSAFVADWSQAKNRGFYNPGTLEQATLPKNSIIACVHESQTVVGETAVRLRLLEPAQASRRALPKGTVITASAKFQNGRLQLNVTSLELDGTIIPVDIIVYDLDGQQGLYVPYSSEMNALTEMAGNMSQTGGTSIMLTQNAGQQVAADLSRGVVQGVSGYFAKKVRTPKVTLKAGHQVLLVSKN